jgi:AcrR family transcriptional regulator
MPSEHKTNETIKYKLATAMKECMKSASVEKITVTEIVETCGVTRQTFYRNFKDKYDLINWYFDKILLESFEHMGEGKTVYEGLVNKFHYIQQEKLFFKAAFKNDDQNCLRDHDFQLICAFYTEQLETRMACRLSRQLLFQLEMYCQGSIYMTVQWVLGYRKCSAEELAHALASAMPEELQTVFHKYGLV